MTKTLCIYHADCADGFAGAWAVRQRFGETNVEFLPAHYGDTPPAVSGRTVILVDFSYPRDTLLQMADQAEQITVIDHHKTASAQLVDLPSNVEAVFDLTHSGAMLAWLHYHPDKLPPVLLDHIEDRDLWRFNLIGTREITAALYSYPMNFDTWDELMHSLRRLHDEGIVLLRKHQQDLGKLLELTTRLMVIGGYAVPVANVPYTMASDAAGQLAVDNPFAATYYDTEKARVFSLRSRSDGLDVSEIAKQYGGGGHQHAAGFRISLQEAWVMDMRVGRLCAPDTIGIELTPDDHDRIESAIAKMQTSAPDLSVDDCINLIFASGLAMTESPKGIKLTKEAA